MSTMSLTSLPSAVKLSASSRYHASAKWTLARRWESKEVDRRAAAAPGPGKYVPGDYDRPRKPTFSFGSTARFKDLSSKSPGPGSHAPVDPNATVLKSSFSKSERLPKAKKSSGPEPGAYLTAENSNAFAMNKGRTMAFRHESQKKAVTPGPGTYTPQTKILQKGGIARFDSGPPRDPFAGKRPTPAPGQYDSHVDFGRPCPMASVRSCPAFSMQSSRRPEPRSDLGVPVLTYYSSLG